MSKLVFITGATSGIGRATAELLASKGWDLILNARRKTLLDELSEDLQNKFKVKVKALAFDISDRKQCEESFDLHKMEFSKVSVLINNAGLARGVDPMDKASLDDWEDMIDTNVKGLLYITRLTLPYLKNNKNSHIINLGSVAGRWTYPGGGVYCSTKFAVRALTEGLRMDLHGSGVRVTNISPGLVETDFSRVRLQDELKAAAVYQGYTPLSPMDIAESIEWSISRPQHVNIQEMVIYPTDQASVTMVNRS
jgi:3-hydroxy acid dehydrogenase / malonic semialdehyde reductase